MTTRPTPGRPDSHVDIDRDRVLDDERAADATSDRSDTDDPGDGAVPDHLDLPVETPEADALEQSIDEPLDDDEVR